MRIGVDACCWANGRGYGRFTRELLRAMSAAAPEDDFVLFLDPWTARQVDLAAPNARTVTADLGAPPTAAASADGRRSLPDLLRLSRAVARERPDVFFSPSVYSYFPLPPRLAAVVTIHDVIVERHPELTLRSRRAAFFWRLKVGLAVRQARLVLTVSDYSAREISTVLDVPPARIRVAEEAPASAYRPSRSEPDVADAARRAGLPPGASWFTYVGGFNPHKRVDGIVRAHARAFADAPAQAPYLLLVGSPGTDSFHQEVDVIRRAVAESRLSSRVIWTGFVPDEELRHLHSGALALVLASEREGFGLPAVEAAACGIPVIATTASPLPRLLEGGGIFLPPGDETAMAHAMRRLRDEPGLRERMGEQALERTRALSWERTARSALAAIREAAA